MHTCEHPKLYGIFYHGAHLYPLPRRLEGLHDLGLPAALLGVEVVLPPRRLRQGHEDGLNAAARLEAEHRPSVVHQVELHVPCFAALFLVFGFSVSVFGYAAV